MIDENHIKTNSVTAWFLAARPKTLSGAAVPVMIGATLAYKDAGAGFQVAPAVLCFLFAFIMQIDSNLINDYFDCVRGNDDTATRLGPKRACAEGWITLPAMRLGMALTTAAGCLVGLPLVCFGGWDMVVVGALCVLFAFLYTTRLSYLGLGDVLVLVFFGIVPVSFTYYVTVPAQYQHFSTETILTGLCCGLIIDCLLTINNFRDRDNDRHDGKITLVVRLGERGALWLYKLLGVVGAVGTYLVIYGGFHTWIAKAVSFLLFALYVCFHATTALKMQAINHGKELNHVLGMTARNMFLYGLVAAFSIVFGTYC